MSIKFDVKVKVDMKGLESIKRKLIKTASVTSQVGFFDGKTHPNHPELSVAQIAAINEFGEPSQNIPERPFMATAVRDTEVEKPLASSMRSYLAGTQTIQGVWRAVGTFMAREISRVIAAFSDPPNAPLTISKKGFDNPLVETGYMRDNVENRIRQR